MARPRKPTATKKIEGNPGKRALNTLEPTPDYLDDLTPPDSLSADAKKIWNELAPPLRRTKLLTVVDRAALETGCQALAQYRKATIKLEEFGFLQDGGDKAGAISQWLIVQSMAFKQFIKVATEFGMSPRARTAIALQAQTDMFTDLEKTSHADTAAKYFN